MAKAKKRTEKKVAFLNKKEGKKQAHPAEEEPKKAPAQGSKTSLKKKAK